MQQQNIQQILVTTPMLVPNQGIQLVNYVPTMPPMQPQMNQTQFLSLPYLAQPVVQQPQLPMPLRYCEKTNQFVPCEYNIDPTTQLLMPWEGYSFIDTRTGQIVSPSISMIRSVSPSPSTLSRSPSPCISRESTPEPPATVEQKPKKFGYLSKQNKIKKVHTRVEDYFQAQKLLVGDNEILRGEDVVRVHVKNYQGLNQIEDTLQLIEQTVSIEKVHTPISMKNERQMKGFIVYLKLSQVEDVSRVRTIFNDNDFKKCDVALPREAPQSDLNKVPSKPSTNNLIPLPMGRQLSAGAA